MLFMGFTESLSRPSGIERLWGMLRRFSNPACCIHTPLQWNADVRERVAFVLRNSAPGAKIMLIAYSWGAGWAAMAFARELQRAQENKDWFVSIEVAVFADPVYRSPLLPAWLPLNFLTLLGLFPIKVPANIRRVRWVRQTQSVPRATGLVAEGPETEIDSGKLIMASHGRADEHPVFVRMCEDEAADFLLLPAVVRRDFMRVEDPFPDDVCEGREVRGA